MERATEQVGQDGGVTFLGRSFSLCSIIGTVGTNWGSAVLDLGNLVGFFGCSANCYLLHQEVATFLRGSGGCPLRPRL
jgi:hypothetical protein